jgi:hypothetical protein
VKTKTALFPEPLLELSEKYRHARPLVPFRLFLNPAHTVRARIQPRKALDGRMTGEPFQSAETVMLVRVSP